MKKGIRIVLIAAVLIFTAGIANAQFSGGGLPVVGGSGGGVPSSGGAVPFDGGLSFILIAVGAGVARKKNLIKTI